MFRGAAAVIFALIFLVATGSSWAQVVVTGIVREKETNQPLQFVNVFLASSTTGTTTAEDGSFKFTVPQKGKYELIASFVGYQSFKKTVSFDRDSSYRFIIQLPQNATELASIVVVADSTSRKKNLKEFRKFFLGQTANANSCEITNPSSIYVYLDEKTQVLNAFSRSPIVIDNRALGYRIFYSLERFEFNYQQQTIFYLGTPRFEELVPKSNGQLNHWKKARKKTYEGSLTHFLQNVRNNTLVENGWDVVVQSEPKSGVVIRGKELMSVSNPRQIAFRGKLLVTFTRETDPRYPPAFRKTIGSSPSGQYSEIEFLQAPITIFDNGYFEPQSAVQLSGYLGWAERVSELLPLGYQSKN